MLEVTIIAVGKLKEKYLADACDEYKKRLGAFCRLSIVELAPARLPDTPSPAEIDAALEKEAAQILQRIPRRAYVLPLCIEGKQLSSEQFAQRLERASGEHPAVALIIGGSHGLAAVVKQRGDFALSMSEMTFPHQLARVMLLEQLYRAFSIIAGQKYHK